MTFMFSTSIKPPPKSYVGLLENKLNHSFSFFGIKRGFSGSTTTSHFLKYGLKLVVSNESNGYRPESYCNK